MHEEGVNVRFVTSRYTLRDRPTPIQELEYLRSRFQQTEILPPENVDVLDAGPRRRRHSEIITMQHRGSSNARDALLSRPNSMDPRQEAEWPPKQSLHPIGSQVFVDRVDQGAQATVSASGPYYRTREARDQNGNSLALHGVTMQAFDVFVCCPPHMITF